jgi:hypothetical protein
LSERTDRAYAGWVHRFVLFNGKRHSRELGAAKSTRFSKRWQTTAA